MGNKLCVGLVGAVAGGYLLRRQVLAVVLIVVVAAGIAVLRQR